jgi:biopolymer transport protein ExbB
MRPSAASRARSIAGRHSASGSAIDPALASELWISAGMSLSRYDARDMQALLEGARNLFSTGGWVMWPLAVLSLLSVTLIVERFLFWGRAATASRRRWASLARKLRHRDLAGARALAEDDHTFLGVFALALIGEMKDGGGALSEVAAREAVEEVRPAIERFSATLSTIITAAPMLGILGTVTGIIRSFAVVGASAAGDGPTDPSLVAEGIAQALYTTAFGLLIAIVTLFPYVIFRARIDRALGRLELMAAASMEGAGGQVSGVRGQESEVGGRAPGARDEAVAKWQSGEVAK